MTSEGIEGNTNMLSVLSLFYSLGQWRWEAILLDSGINELPKRKKLTRERLSPFHKSASNITRSVIAM